MSEMSFEIDQQFWGDRLEVNTDLLLKQHQDDDYLEKWASRIKMRARTVLLNQLGIENGLKAADAHEAILAHKNKLIPYRLVEAAVAGKRSYAIIEVAHAKLTPEEVELCHEKEDRYDRIGLAWLLFVQDPHNLELVFHLDRTQRKGFARMVIERPPQLNGTDLKTFFSKDGLQEVLDEYEEKHNTFRKSHCAAVLESGGNYQLFIKRDLKPGFVSDGEKNTFGFEREWIVLEFEPDLKRVFICSVSPDTPLVLANRIAGKLFERSVEYANEIISTGEDNIVDFLQKLGTNQNGFPLVEVTVKNSGLDGSPQLRINDQSNDSIAPALSQLGGTFGHPLEVVEDIESIKVYHYKKRIKMIFEKLEGSDEKYVVRYADQPLNGSQRREFEQQIENEHGITVLSTEKKHHAQ